jgi:SAM-dependent methyltransferase
MANPSPHPVLVCCGCKGRLETAAGHLSCAACNVRYPCADGIADFSGGSYYDNFPGPEVLTDANRQGLANERETSRIEDFYVPLLARPGGSRRVSRILDSGCGSGESVDLLNRRGFDAWGYDLSALRKWQWRERERRDRLVVAGGASLPFPAGFFDAVIASGVLEHIGVSEEGGTRYRVRPLPDRDERRREYLAELLRVTAPGGRLLLDFPNGSFPVDFWHGVNPGGARFHSPGEGFLPTVQQVRLLCARIDPSLVLSVRSPEGRLRFRQVSTHWYGRAFRAPVRLLQRLMSTRTFGFLASSPLNPYLVIEITRPAAV